MSGRNLPAVVLLLVAGLLQPWLRAADPKPVVGPGATKDAVIDAYGWPNGQSQSGTKEILSYPQGQVTLENGRVERVDFSMNVPWPAPRPRPGAASPTTVKKGEAPLDFWVTRFEDASREAARRNARILALFTGSDWSPASKQFHEEVEFHPDFINAFTGDFVFLRLDFTTRAPMPAELREQNAKLRARYGVTVYPSLLVLSPLGTEVGRVDLAKPHPGDTYRARVIAAVHEVRDQLLAKPPPPDPVAEDAPVPAPVAATAEQPAPKPAAAPLALVRSLATARSVVVLGIVGGVALAGVLFWLVWRTSPGPKTSPRAPLAMATRISDAASGLPNATQMAGWPKEKVRAIIAGLAETDGYTVEPQPEGSDKDLVLKRAGDTKPRVLVCCEAGAAGIIPAKRIRELLATLTVDGVEVGWFAAPGGFAADARTYAEQHRVVLMDAEHLAAQLRDLPPLLLPKVLMRT